MYYSLASPNWDKLILMVEVNHSEVPVVFLGHIESFICIVSVKRKFDVEIST